MPREKFEKFELSEKPHPYIPVSTTKILESFTRDSPPDIPDAVLQERRSQSEQHAETVQMLRTRMENYGSGTVAVFIKRIFLWNELKTRILPALSILPTIDYFFPPRMEKKVMVCDFGHGRAERKEVRLGDIEKELGEKPSWSQVRWIHAPLGVGLFHSSVEALFFHAGSKLMGRPFTKAGRAGWPYLEIEALDLRNARSIQDSRDLLRIMKNDKQISEDLKRSVFAGDNNQKLKKDIVWRAQFLGQDINFWDCAKDDLPWQLSEGSELNMNGPSEGLRTTKLDMSSQSLATHPLYKDTYLARNPFRCFHRNDGFLLTMSPAAGVDYLNSNLQYYLQISQEELAQDNFASAIAQVWREFSETGTQTWYRQDVEWFLVYLITEVGTTPHSIRQGHSIPSLMDAYDAIVHDLKERRYDQWKRSETIKLVRSYLVTMDELKVLGEIFTKKLTFFQRLREDCEDLQTGVQPDNEEGESPFSRLNFAEHTMKDSRDRCERLSADLRESLNTLFQLRSIEQNELAIVADTNNKAIFVFTAITIVFLPLSFFTSYFGMNLKGVMNTDRTEEYFWKVCGSISVAIVLITCMYAFRYKVQQRIMAYHV